MKTILITITIALIASFAVSAETFVASSQDQNLYAAFISYDAIPEVEIAKAFNSELKKPESKISKYLSNFAGKVAEVSPTNLTIVINTNIDARKIVQYIMAIKIIGDSSKTTFKQISVLYYSDLSEEEIGLSTRIYFQEL